MKNIVFVMLLIGPMSCASFKDGYVKDRVALKTTELRSFNGAYAMTTDYNYDKNAVLERTTIPHPDLSLYSVITNKVLMIDSTINYYAKINFNADMIHFDFYKGTEKFESVDMKAKLKKDGLFYLDNTQIEIRGAPYLYGRPHIIKPG